MPSLFEVGDDLIPPEKEYFTADFSREREEMYVLRYVGECTVTNMKISVIHSVVWLSMNHYPKKTYTQVK